MNTPLQTNTVKGGGRDIILIENYFPIETK